MQKPFETFFSEKKEETNKKLGREDLDKMMEDPNYDPINKKSYSSNTPFEQKDEDVYSRYDDVNKFPESLFDLPEDVDRIEDVIDHQEENKKEFIDNFSNEEGLSSYITEGESDDLMEEFENNPNPLNLQSKKEGSNKDKEGREMTNFEILFAEEAYKFKKVLDQNNLKGLNKPTFNDGQEMSKDQIKKIVKEYFECKDKNLWKEFSDKEIDFMKQCATWNYFENKLTKGQLSPAFVDGKTLKYDQLIELSKEFEEFRDKNPKEFIKYKLETEQWIQGVFKWKSENHKGKKYLISVFFKKEKDESGKEMVHKIKYIIEDKNKNTPLEEKVNGLIEVNNKKELDKNFTIVFGKIIKMEKMKK